MTSLESSPWDCVFYSGNKLNKILSAKPLAGENRLVGDRRASYRAGRRLGRSHKDSATQDSTIRHVLFALREIVEALCAAGRRRAEPDGTGSNAIAQYKVRLQNRNREIQREIILANTSKNGFADFFLVVEPFWCCSHRALPLCSRRSIASITAAFSCAKQ